MNSFLSSWEGFLMVSKQTVEDEQPSTSPDEGWWASILADEENFAGSGWDMVAKPKGNSPPLQIDWDLVHRLYEGDEVISLEAEGFNRGGVLVSGEGLQGFVPISHLTDVPSGISEDRRNQVLASYVGRLLSLKVIECQPGAERVVFSERAALAGEGRRKTIFKSLKPGDVVHGAITNITDFGVFVDLGGLEGLIHVSELSWGRVQHPSEIISIGQAIDALVLQVSEESGRVALSLKRLTSNPWETICVYRSPGDVVTATITATTKYGAFARLQEGVEGLIHISTINQMDIPVDLEKFLPSGSKVQVRILHIDPDRRRLGLSLVSVE
jgi:small subunit ribosomal protein S1